MDLVGYGTTANFFEGGGPAPAPSNTTSVQRGAAGCTDTDQNAADFDRRRRHPRHATPPRRRTPALPTSRSWSTATGLSTVLGVAASTAVSAADADGRVTSLSITQVTPSPAPGSIVLGDLVPAAGVGGTATATVTVAAGTLLGTYAVLVAAANDDPRAADGKLHAHRRGGGRHGDPRPPGRRPPPPRNGQAVSGVTGVVTARAANGFFLQDPRPDADQATSEALFVFTSAAPTVAVGDAVVVGGRAAEFRPGGSDSANLTTTELTGPRSPCSPPATPAGADRGGDRRARSCPPP